MTSEISTSVSPEHGGDAPEKNRGTPRRGALRSRAPYRSVIIGKGSRNVNVGGRTEEGFLLYVVDTQG